MLSDIQVQTIAEDRSMNLFLADTRQLLELVRDDFLSQGVRARAFAELVARWCLSRNGEIDSALDRMWPDWSRDFKPWYDGCAAFSRTLPESEWKEPANLPSSVICVRERLLRLFAVDGFIPVIVRNGKEISAFFIPFELDEELPSGSVVYYDYSSVTEWHDMASAFDGVKCRCRLQMLPEEDMHFEGESLMLPLRMAAWRKFDPSFPKYDPLRVVATGRFDASGHLAEVDVKAKFDAFGGQFSEALFIAPDGCGEIGSGCSSFVRLDCGISRPTLKGSLIKILERTDWVRMTYEYALRRFSDLYAEVDRENHARWNDLAERLSRFRATVNPRRDGVRYLQFMMMLVTALCHAGKTDEAKDVRDETYRYAVENGHEALALRLQIDAVVIAQAAGTSKGVVNFLMIWTDGLNHSTDLKKATCRCATTERPCRCSLGALCSDCRDSPSWRQKRMRRKP